MFFRVFLSCVFLVVPHQRNLWKGTVIQSFATHILGIHVHLLLVTCSLMASILAILHTSSLSIGKKIFKSLCKHLSWNVSSLASSPSSLATSNTHRLFYLFCTLWLPRQSCHEPELTCRSLLLGFAKLHILMISYYTKSSSNSTLAKSDDGHRVSQRVWFTIELIWLKINETIQVILSLLMETHFHEWPTLVNGCFFYFWSLDLGNVYCVYIQEGS